MGLTQGRADGKANVEVVIEDLRAHLAEISEGKLTVAGIDPAGHLFDYGYVDSLSAVMFLAHIEERWGVTIEDVDLVEKFTSLRALADHVRSSL